MSTTVASFEIAGGAADSALLIFAASVAGGLTGPTLRVPAALLALGFDWDDTGTAEPTARPTMATAHTAVNRNDTLHLQAIGNPRPFASPRRGAPPPLAYHHVPPRSEPWRSGAAPAATVPVTSF